MDIIEKAADAFQVLAGGGERREASWRLSDGSGALFIGPFHRLVLIGKDVRGTLETDLRLRDELIPAVS